MDAVPQFAHFYTMALAAASFSNDVYTDIPKTKDVPELLSSYPDAESERQEHSQRRAIRN